MSINMLTRENTWSSKDAVMDTRRAKTSAQVESKHVAKKEMTVTSARSHFGFLHMVQVASSILRSIPENWVIAAYTAIFIIWG